MTQANHSMEEKCQKIIEQFRRQATVDLATYDTQCSQIIRDIKETEVSLKSCINWRKITPVIDSIRENNELANYKIPILGWLIILCLIWFGLSMMIKPTAKTPPPVTSATTDTMVQKSKNKQKTAVSAAKSSVGTSVEPSWYEGPRSIISFIFAFVCVAMGYYYVNIKKRILEFSTQIDLRLMYFDKMDYDPQFAAEFLYRKVVTKNSEEFADILTVEIPDLGETPIPDNCFTIGIFVQEKLAGIILPDQNNCTAFTFKTNKKSKFKFINNPISNDIQHILESEDKGLDETSDFLEKIDQVSIALNCPLNLSKVRQAWESIVLNPSEIEEMSRALVAFACNSISSPRGILLKGPPGTGKSVTAQAFAKSLDVNFIKCSVADLKGQLIGASGANVKQLWNNARENEPSIIFIDECEGIFAKRGSDNSDNFSNEMVQNFLTEWDGLGDSKSQVLVIGATNRAELLDDAIVSRFTDIIELLPADASSRPKMVNAIAKQAGIVTRIPDEIISILGGMSGREMRNVMERAIRLAMSNSPSLQHYEDAINKIRGKSSTKTSKDASWDSLILPESLIGRLKTLCHMVKDSEALSAKGIPVPKALLLHGPPGTGKTQIARTLANEAGVSFFSYTTSDLKGQYLGHAAARIKQAFETARASSPSIMFIDEIDALTSSRNNGGHDSLQNEALTQMLQELDGVANKSGDVLVVAATNLPDDIDSAILSRFSQRLEIGLPTTEERTLILDTLLKSRPVQLTMSTSYIAEQCAGYSGRSLRELISNAFNHAVERTIASGRGAKETVLTDDDMIRSI